MKRKLEKSVKEHRDYCNQSNIEVCDIDYKNADKYLALLQALDSLNTSLVMVVDFYKNDYFYVSEKFNKIFGFHINQLQLTDQDWYRNRFHPEDYIINIAGIEARKFLQTRPIVERKDYKLTHEFRFKNDNDDWIRVIVQDNILEIDKKGNLWLNLKLWDLVPIQDVDTPGSSVFRNSLTGKVIFTIEGKKEAKITISVREQEVLKLMSSGLRSKEIANKLFISVNTVNNHRKNLMEKLNVVNAAEAVKQASALGII